MAQSSRNGIDDGFEKLDQAGKLCLRQTINQLVRVLTSAAQRVFFRYDATLTRDQGFA